MQTIALINARACLSTSCVLRSPCSDAAQAASGTAMEPLMRAPSLGEAHAAFMKARSDLLAVLGNSRPQYESLLHQASRGVCVYMWECVGGPNHTEPRRAACEQAAHLRRGAH